jgi:hypothetical protein
MSETTREERERDTDALEEIGNGESIECVLDICSDRPTEPDDWTRRTSAIERLLKRSLALGAAEGRVRELERSRDGYKDCAADALRREQEAKRELERVRAGVEKEASAIATAHGFAWVSGLRALLAGEGESSPEQSSWCESCHYKPECEFPVPMNGCHSKEQP